MGRRGVRPGWSAALGSAAGRVRASLGQGDPLVGTVERFVGLAESAESWADLALAIVAAEPIFEFVATWPEPVVEPVPTDLLREEPGESDRSALDRIDSLRWLATIAALEALEHGKESEMGRLLAAGAVTLHCGDATGVGWLLRAVELSRIPPHRRRDPDEAEEA